MNIEQKIANAKKVLANLYKETGPEQVGFLLENSLVEVVNVCNDPMHGFDVHATDIIQYTEKQTSWATWHTHPGSPSNLSGEDYNNFQAWASLYHFIIGNDGVRCFKYDYDKKSILEV